MKKFVAYFYIFAILFNIVCALLSFFEFKDYESGCWQLFAAIMFCSCFANYYLMVKWMNRTKFLQDECEDYKDFYNDILKENTRLQKSLNDAQKYIPNRGKDGKFVKKDEKTITDSMLTKIANKYDKEQVYGLRLDFGAGPVWADFDNDNFSEEPIKNFSRVIIEQWLRVVAPDTYKGQNVSFSFEVYKGDKIVRKGGLIIA